MDDLFRGPVEKDGEAFSAGFSADAQHQVRSVDPLFQVEIVAQIETPPHRLSVWNHQIKAIQAVSMVVIVDSGHHSMRCKGTDAQGSTVSSRRHDNGNGFGGFQCVNKNPQDGVLSHALLSVPVSRTAWLSFLPEP